MAIAPQARLDDLEQHWESCFQRVCEEGYATLGRTRGDAPGIRENPWQYGAGRPPSYPAAGRFRFLETLRLAESLRPRSVLEVAAGGGFNAACLARPGRRVVANDLRREALDASPWVTGNQIESVPGNCFDLDPEKLGTFDLVMACELIEHVAHGKELVAHLKRFLAPGGALLITTPNGAYFRSRLPTYGQIKDFASLEARQFQPDADGHLYLYTPSELQAVLAGCGFRDVRIELAITPWISGGAGFRFLPKGRALSRWYRRLDAISLRLLGPERIGNQIFAVARLSAGATAGPTAP